MWHIPRTVLNQFHGDRTRQRKRRGFNIFDRLVCKECHPARTFHKSGGLLEHHLTCHEGEGVDDRGAGSTARRKSSRSQVELAMVEEIKERNIPESDADNDVEIVEVVQVTDSPTFQ